MPVLQGSGQSSLSGGDVHPREQPHLHISCSGRRLEGTVLPKGEGTGTWWGQEQGGVATVLHLLQNDPGSCCPH